MDIPVEIDELCDKMVMAGFEVEDIEKLADTMQNVVVARIVKLEKHPDADRLKVCQMDIGADEPVQIVTGADNVFEGALVPAALHNSLLPNGTKITKGKLRGVPSNGMLCSGEELCLKDCDYPGAEVYGIMILKEDYPVGTDMRDVLGLWDTIVDFKITANRPDCQSVLGVAREIGVVLKTNFHPPVPTYNTIAAKTEDDMAVEVENFLLCERFCGARVHNLKIAESPVWMKRALRASGMRPINNIVDITNFVMLETGFPMHAYDRRDIRGGKLIARTARKGDRITTLDGKDHDLTEEMLVIADAEGPSGLAGIMGGLNSEIKEDTTQLFLEVAKFRRDCIRRTARKLGMRTEASARYEKGVDTVGCEYALKRALQLIDELGAGEVCSSIIDCNNGLPSGRQVVVTGQSINALLGLQIPVSTMSEILNSLCIETTVNGDTLTCKIPSFREDIEGRADLAEEVMRIYGYDHIVGTTMTGAVVRGQKLPARIKDDRVKAALVADGCSEIATYSFISGKAIDTLQLTADDDRRSAVTLLNPLGEEYSTMRTQLVTSMLNVLSTNYNRKAAGVRMFELSKVFLPKALPVTQQPEERPALCIGLYGQDEDFFTLKGIVEDVLGLFGVNAPCKASAEPYYHPGRQAEYLLEGKRLAVLGEIHPATAEKYSMDTRVYLAEIDLGLLYAVEKPAVLFKPLPKFPAVTRDFALLADIDLPIGDMMATIRAAAGALCEDIQLFDVYTGAQIPAGKKSVAFSVVLRSHEATLTEEEVTRVTNKIIKKLAEQGATLRS